MAVPAIGTERPLGPCPLALGEPGSTPSLQSNDTPFGIAAIAVDAAPGPRVLRLRLATLNRIGWAPLDLAVFPRSQLGKPLAALALKTEDQVMSSRRCLALLAGR